MNKTTTDPFSSARSLIESSLAVHTGAHATASRALQAADQPHSLGAPAWKRARWDLKMLPAPLLLDLERLEHPFIPALNITWARMTFLHELPGASPGRTEIGHDAAAVTKELAALRHELAELREARLSDQREIQDLRRRVQEAEERLDELLAMQDFDVEEAPVDPHARWIEQNLEELRRYPDMFVALDPERGILVHAAEQSEFAEKLKSLTPEENERVMLFHTSMYLRG